MFSERSQAHLNRQAFLGIAYKHQQVHIGQQHSMPVMLYTHALITMILFWLEHCLGIEILDWAIDVNRIKVHEELTSGTKERFTSEVIINKIN